MNQEILKNINKDAYRNPAMTPQNENKAVALLEKRLEEIGRRLQENQKQIQRLQAERVHLENEEAEIKSLLLKATGF